MMDSSTVISVLIVHRMRCIFRIMQSLAAETIVLHVSEHIQLTKIMYWILRLYQYIAGQQTLASEFDFGIEHQDINQQGKPTRV